MTIISNPELTDVVQNQGVVTRIGSPIAIGPISIDLHLAAEFVRYDEYPHEPFTPPKELRTTTTCISQNNTYPLPPSGRVLACTQERIKIPNDVVGLVQAKSSIARGFLLVHMGAGLIDPGYEGTITLEIANLSEFYYALRPGMAVARLVLMRLSSAVNPYTGKYQGAGSPVGMLGPKTP